MELVAGPDLTDGGQRAVPAGSNEAGCLVHVRGAAATQEAACTGMNLLQQPGCVGGKPQEIFATEMFRNRYIRQ